MCKKQNIVIEQMLVAAGPSIIPAKDMRRKREKKSEWENDAKSAQTSGRCIMGNLF